MHKKKKEKKFNLATDKRKLGHTKMCHSLKNLETANL